MCWLVVMVCPSAQLKISVTALNVAEELLRKHYEKHAWRYDPQQLDKHLLVCGCVDVVGC